MKAILFKHLMLAVCVLLAFKAPAEEESPWPEYARDRIEVVTAKPEFEFRRKFVSLRVGYYSIDWEGDPELLQDPDKCSEYMRNRKYYGDEVDLDPSMEYTFELIHWDYCGEDFEFEQQYHYPEGSHGCVILLRILKGGKEIYRPETCFRLRSPEPLPDACNASPETPLVAEMKRLLHLRALCEVRDRWDYLPAYFPSVAEIEPCCEGSMTLAEATRKALDVANAADVLLLVEQALHDHTVFVLLIDPLAGNLDAVSVDMHDGNCTDAFYLTPHPIEATRLASDLPLFIGTFEEEWAHGTAVTAIYTRENPGNGRCERYRANSIYMAFH